MSGKVTIDHAGRVVLPKTLQDELRLRAGDTLDFSVDGDQLTLRPARGVRKLYQERGVWVLSTGEPLPAGALDDTLRDLRDPRRRH